MTNVSPHPFASTGDASDQTLCISAIRVDNTLLIASEQVVGLL